MDRVAARGGADEMTRYRRLVNATIAATFVLIVIGGIVRVSDSGLGCGREGSGTHGWPLCEGGVLPGSSHHTVIEFSHRMAATIVVLLIGALIIFSLRRLRNSRLIVRGSAAAGVLVIGQAVLGGLTVEKGLEDELVAAHLGLAMLLLGLLIILRRATEAPAGAAENGSRRLRTASSVATGLVLCTIVAGGYVAGTEGEGTPSEPVRGAHLACGEQFPGCVGKFMPFGEDRLIDIQLVHRLLMYLAALSILALVVIAAREGSRSRAFGLLGALVVAQILLGAMNVWLGKHPGLILAHLTLGTCVWATAIHGRATLFAVPAPADTRIEPATAAGAAAA